MNISENLQRILTDKQNIANAINAKGVSCQFSESLDTYADKISRISGGGGDKPLPGILDTDPLTFVRVDKFIENGYISLEKFGNPSSKVFSYNKNDEGWKTYTEGTKIPMNYGDKVQFTSYSATGMSTSSTDYRQFKTNGVYNCGGDINSLLQSSKVCPSYCFYKLFYGCNIITAPNLTSITVNDYSYYQMFQGCTLLVNAPSLPATTLADRCYSQMFAGCTLLYNAPSLPATTLARNCYSSMFQGCTLLVNAPSLPATTLVDGCYLQMFWNCTSLVNAPALPVTTLADRCYYQMFADCTSLVNAPALPATTLANECYSNMFYGCTSLVNAPALPATTLADECYSNMFQGCASLVNAPALPATTLAYGCYYQMFYGCTSLVNAPALPATTLADDCYVYMFYGCTNIKEIYCNIRYNSDGKTEITSMIGYSWLSGVPDTTDCTFHKNPDWSGPTRRGNNTIPSNWQIVNWTQDTM